MGRSVSRWAPADPRNVVGCYALRDSTGAFLPASFRQASPYVELANESTLIRLDSARNPIPEGFPPPPNLFSWNWLISARGDTLLLVFSNGFSGTIMRFPLNGSAERILRGRAATFIDVGPPFEDRSVPVTATKFPCLTESSILVEDVDWHGPPVDHIIVAIDSLERGMAMFYRGAGIKPVYGGVHPGRGTRNALVSLGGGRYLEIIAPNPADTSSSGTERKKSFAKFQQLTPYGWAVHTNDIDSVAAEFVKHGFPRAEVTPGSRARSDGRILKWRTLDPWGADNPILPFFIQWDKTSVHPSEDAPKGCTLRDVIVTGQNRDSLEARFLRGGIHPSIHPRLRETLWFTLRCRGRDVAIADYSR